MNMETPAAPGGSRQNEGKDVLTRWFLFAVRKQMDKEFGMLESEASPSEMNQILGASLSYQFRGILKALSCKSEERNALSAQYVSAIPEGALKTQKDIAKNVISATQPFIDFLLSRWTIEEIHAAMLGFFEKNKPERTAINELVYVETNKSGTTLYLHLLSPLNNNPKKMIELFNEAMATIAEKINKEELKGLTKISGGGSDDVKDDGSWVAYKNKEILERLGFTLVKENEKSKRAIMEISVPDFLARYSKKQ